MICVFPLWRLQNGQPFIDLGHARDGVLAPRFQMLTRVSSLTDRAIRRCSCADGSACAIRKAPASGSPETTAVLPRPSAARQRHQRIGRRTCCRLAHLTRAYTNPLLRRERRGFELGGGSGCRSDAWLAPAASLRRHLRTRLAASRHPISIDRPIFRIHGTAPPPQMHSMVAVWPVPVSFQMAIGGHWNGTE